MSRDEIIQYLLGVADGELFERSRAVKLAAVGDRVYLRGLVELSNICRKNCRYCGIRCSNASLDRYELDRAEVLSAVRYAINERYGSVVLQAGEQTSDRFISFIENLLREITQISGGELGVTLSLGEQTPATYRRWREAGAHRYLLRIESFNEALYRKIHPASHSWTARMACLESLRAEGYQLGTGVMIGLPYQMIEDLADDLIGLQRLDVDMCGMGPYVEHHAAPLSRVESAYPTAQRVQLTLRMVALLRILMPTINIASTTALDALCDGSRAECLRVGANVIMPNISPRASRLAYSLYENKPTDDFDLSPYDIAYGEQGNSLHFTSASPLASFDARAELPSTIQYQRLPTR